MSPRRLTVVTASELNAWRACPHRWGLAYAEGLRPRETAKPLRVGTAIHAGLAAACATIGATPPAGLDLLSWAKREAARAIAAAHDEATAKIKASGVEWADDLEAETDEIAELGKWVSEHYVDRFANDWQHLVPIGIEVPFELPLRDVRGRLAPHLRVAGVIDLVAFDRRVGDVIVIDHKTTSGTIDGLDRKIELDPQIAGYVWAMRELVAKLAVNPLLTPAERELMSRPGVVSGRVAFNVIRKSIPRAPKVNKDGRVSAAAIDTLPELYREALEVQAGDRRIPVTDEQRERLESLRGKGETYIARREFWLSPDDVERWRRELFVEAGRIRQAEQDPAFRTRNPLACTMASSPACAYRSLCLDPSADSTGFEKRPRHVEVEEARGTSDGQ